jgi:hypothetical protein
MTTFLVDSDKSSEKTNDSSIKSDDSSIKNYWLGKLMEHESQSAVAIKNQCVNKKNKNEFPYVECDRDCINKLSENIRILKREEAIPKDVLKPNEVYTWALFFLSDSNDLMFSYVKVKNIHEVGTTHINMMNHVIDTQAINPMVFSSGEFKVNNENDGIIFNTLSGSFARYIVENMKDEQKDKYETVLAENLELFFPCHYEKITLDNTATFIDANMNEDTEYPNMEMIKTTYYDKEYNCKAQSQKRVNEAKAAAKADIQKRMAEKLAARAEAVESRKRKCVPTSGGSAKRLQIKKTKKIKNKKSNTKPKHGMKTKRNTKTKRTMKTKRNTK